MTEPKKTYYVTTEGPPCPSCQSTQYRKRDGKCYRCARRAADREQKRKNREVREVSPSDYLWMDDAACRGEDVNTFFIAGHEGDFAEAKAICAGCPVKAKCLATFSSEDHGVFGGKAPRERQGIQSGRRGFKTCSGCFEALRLSQFTKIREKGATTGVRSSLCRRCLSDETYAEVAVANFRPTRAKLSHEQEADLVRAYRGGNFYQTELAEKYGLSKATVCKIIKKYEGVNVDGDVIPNEEL